MPLKENLLVAGTRWRLRTNSESILEGARELFPCLPAHGDNTELDLHFWVDQSGPAQLKPWPKPYFRGLGRFVFAGFDASNSVLADLRRKEVLGRFTPAFAEDRKLWKKVVFPILPAILGPSLQVAIMHAACIEENGRGLLLAGPSGSGKSTLALALCRRGFGYLADDRTYMSRKNGRLFAWSVGGFLKLRDEPQGRSALSPAPTQLSDGHRDLEFDPELELGLKRTKCCEPYALVFLEQGRGEAPEMRETRVDEVADLLDRDLKCDSSEPEFRENVFHSLANLPCFVLRTSTDQQDVAKCLASLLDRQAGEPRPRTTYSRVRSHFEQPKDDPLRRATPLDYKLKIRIMGKFGALETNSTEVFEVARMLFGISEADDGASPAFTWRIVCEESGHSSALWPPSSALSVGAIRYVNIGQRSFAAISLETAEAVGFVSDSLAKDGSGFASIYLATLCYLTAPLLKLTPIMAGCVSKDGKGLLLLGPPRSGKTSCAYASSKIGLEFHADMASFVELHEGKLQSWGEFWPALFRKETARIHPELKYLGRTLEHESESFIALEKKLLCSHPASPVTPTIAVVLERSSAGGLRMVRLSSGEYWEALLASPPYEEQGNFRLHQEQVLRSLAKIPAFKLIHGHDSAEAAKLCRSLLTAQDILRAVP